MIAIVTDSTCDLPAEFMEKYSIEFVPLIVHFKEDTYYDKIDLDSDKLFSMMENSDELPTTSQPSVGLFIEKYQKLAAEYDQIISIHISSALSGTLESARLAAQQVEDIAVEVIDSKSTSSGLGFLVLLAAEMIESGKSVEEIKETLSVEREKLTIYFTVNELTYLEKGGRIGKAQAFLGSIFNFNPILELSTEVGEITPKEKIRGYKKTNQKMIELALEAAGNSDQVNFAYVYGEESDNFLQFKELFAAELQKQNQYKYNILENKIGTVLSSHTGPLVYGIVIYRGELLGE
ncbi:DegV family protein [Halanaerobium congolense]|mgnify:CR=1 FL=1|jgi:DegV family protein with EDD domain|uniref:EDD domain protein, DegV family n=1 Tax=Halanaerobium congolense TaxID=54121 RepID=A0A1G8HMN4_9FIRM|nr:DegV family protein [Halanaerobium congolense]KXS50093.1 MAG: degV family protein [Halanaerobium sp. T82-1]PUU90515.1 MAG: degV family protein [Halanaerobium sp.]TDP26902.1 DegV family protein with EDD domain [Halanaerobium congolense]SDH33178.1 EDD domain protein, DegV family [Halanaerobium congolense]SDI07928.1 EDD domain protein, DegV family [Halanaerobium congolense]